MNYVFRVKLYNSELPGEYAADEVRESLRDSFGEVDIEVSLEHYEPCRNLNDLDPVIEPILESHEPRQPDSRFFGPGTVAARQIEERAIHIGDEEGDVCNRWVEGRFCHGIMFYPEVEGCYCHTLLMPPCSQCTENSLICTRCGSSPND